MVQLRGRVLAESAAGTRAQQPHPVRGPPGRRPTEPAAQRGGPGVQDRETGLPLRLGIVGIYFRDVIAVTVLLKLMKPLL